MKKLLASVLSLALVLSLFTGFSVAAEGITLDVGVGKTYTTIQEAVNIAQAGDTIKVYPGVYNDGQYVSINQNGLSIIGVNSIGVPIDSADNVLATVGPFDGGEADMVFNVVADNVTISGIRVADKNNKAMTINGDNFKLTSCEFKNQFDSSGAIYFYDATPGIKSDINKSKQKCFTITANKINGWGVAITDGTGCGWPAANRIISNNIFDGSSQDPMYYSIGFRSVNGSGWCNSPVGGATITNNTFKQMGSRGYVYFDGTVSVDGSSFKDIIKNNTFTNGAVLAFDSTGKARTALSSDPAYNPTSRPNLVMLKNVISDEITKAQAGDTINFAEGTYSASQFLILAEKAGLTIQGAGIDKTIFELTTPSDGFKVQANNTTLKDFTISTVEGTNKAIYGLRAQGVDNLTVQNVKIINMKKTAFDINGVTNSNLSGLIAENNGGYGIAINQSKGVTLSGTTTNSGWGAVLVANKIQPFTNTETSGINISGVASTEFLRLNIEDYISETNIINGVTFDSTYMRAPIVTNGTPKVTSYLVKELITVNPNAAKDLVTRTYTDLYDAVLASQNGDTIKVYPDTYTGDIAINKAVTLMGVDANGVAITNKANVITNIVGNITINVPNVTLQGFNVNGDVTIGAGVGDGDAFIKYVIIADDHKLNVQGGGAHSINLESVTIPNVIVDKGIVAGSEVVSIKVDADSVIRTVTINTQSTVNLAVGSTVATLNVAAAATGTTVTGLGEIETANVDANDVSLETQPIQTVLDPSVTSIIIGENSYSSPVITKLTVTSGTGTLGENVTVKVNVSDITNGISGAVIKVNYDTAWLEYVGSTSSIGVVDNNGTIAFASATNITGEIVAFTFKIKDDYQYNTADVVLPITIEVSDAVSVDATSSPVVYKDVIAEIVAGTITITPKAITLGDVNGDGKINPTDAVTILRSLIYPDEALKPWQIAAADVVGGHDGVTVSDASAILQKIVGKTVSF
jgi:hypothetical protein